MHIREEQGERFDLDCKIKNLKIRYSIVGHGEYVFIFHGWGCTLEVYESIVSILKEKYTVVTFDFPGFGKSEIPSTVWASEDYTDFAIEFINYFDCKKISIIGHSFGTRIMTRMCNRKSLPFVIEKMVFINGAGILPCDIDEYQKEFHAFQSKKEELLNKKDNAGLSILRAKANGDYAYLDETMCGCCINAATDNIYNLLPQINCPTLLIYGENDMETPVEHGKIMEKLIPDAGLVVVKNAGHFSFLDQPYVFKRVLCSFFEIGDF